MVYDVTNPETFENIANWLDEARVNGNPEMVLCLVANKCDLTNKRQVSTQDGEKLASENGLLYVETSALSSEGVNSAFEKIAERVLDKLKRGVIDPKIEEFGVREVGGGSQNPGASSGSGKTKQSKSKTQSGTGSKSGGNVMVQYEDPNG